MLNPYPHRIRLRGPWTMQVLPQGQIQRLNQLDTWGDFRGTMLYERRFGYPGQIDSDERIWLTMAGYTGVATICLNGQMVTQNQPGNGSLEFDVTSLLGMRNRLQVELTGEQGGGLWGEVALEIRCLAYLRNIVMKLPPEQQPSWMEISGEVVGPEEELLDLYAVCNRRSIGFQKIKANPAGTPFYMVADPAHLERNQQLFHEKLTVQIDLVKGGQVWYTKVEEPQLPPKRVIEENG